MKLKILFKYLRDEEIRRFFAYSIKNFKKPNLNNNTQKTPDYILEDINNLDRERVSNNLGIISLVKNTKYFNNKKLKKNNRKILLAGEELIINYENINWLKLFEDDEDTSAYHRFIWMYTDFIHQLEEGVSKKELYDIFLELLKKWNKTFNINEREKYHSEVFQTYTISERLVNWFYILSLISDKKEIKDKEIYSSIYEQILFICNNLEYYGENFTGNHLSNNGKAIYIIGSSLNIEELQEIGRKILLNEYKRITVNQGFLREGSSHYQLLITKNYLDSYFIALNFHDTEFINKLFPIVENLSRACKYFIVNDEKDKLPLIGDISPDYPPNWIITVPDVADALLYGKVIQKKSIGYHTPFEIEYKEYKENKKRIEIPLNDWGKISYKGWNIFSHVNNTLYPNNLTGHFHHDTGAVVIFYRGETIVTDCGRITYKTSARGTRDKSIRAHSGIWIDKKEPEIDMRTFYSKEFLNRYICEKPKIQTYENKMLIDIRGYNRLKGITSISRMLEVNEDKIKIIDNFEGKGEHEIDLLFHIPFEVKLLKENNILEINGKKENFFINFDKKLKIKNIKGNDKNIDGHTAVSYGKDRILNTVIASVKLSFPNRIITTIYKEG